MNNLNMNERYSNKNNCLSLFNPNDLSASNDILINGKIFLVNQNIIDIWKTIYNKIVKSTEILSEREALRKAVREFHNEFDKTATIESFEYYKTQSKEFIKSVKLTIISIVLDNLDHLFYCKIVLNIIEELESTRLEYLKRWI
jgi:hypothetical protein